MPVLPLTSPVAEEEASLAAAIRTDHLHRTLGAPELAKPSLYARLAGVSTVGETDMSPTLARSLTRAMRATTARLRAKLRQGRVCQRGHALTGANVYHGASGDQCRSCRNASRRALRLAA